MAGMGSIREPFVPLKSAKMNQWFRTFAANQRLMQNPDNSDTPRTEAERDRQQRMSGKPAVSVDFTRTLELEITALRDALRAMLQSANPNKRDHPVMFAAWEAGHEALTPQKK